MSSRRPADFVREDSDNHFKLMTVEKLDDWILNSDFDVYNDLEGECSTEKSFYLYQIWAQKMYEMKNNKKLILIDQTIHV